MIIVHAHRLGLRSVLSTFIYQLAYHTIVYILYIMGQQCGACEVFSKMEQVRMDYVVRVFHVLFFKRFILVSPVLNNAFVRSALCANNVL